MSNEFKAYQQLKKETGLGTVSKGELLSELSKRESVKNPFPLHVFHPDLHPYINALNKHCDIPAPFIGLSLISCYSTAIGTAYTVSTNAQNEIFLPVWACNLGLSSSGKSYILDEIYAPLNAIQQEYDRDWRIATKGVSDQQQNNMNMPTIIFRDSHIPTLVRYVLPDNPKGVAKFSDELLEWINGMNQLSKKEGTDEQFWLSAWNCRSYSGIRSGKNKFSIPRPFVNVVGGIQYKLVERLFAKDRDTTGFIFRMLFARPDSDKIAEIDPHYVLPPELRGIHTRSINKLYNELKVEMWDDEPTEPMRCILTREAVALYDIWVKQNIKRINELPDRDDRDIQGGILGKIKEYALRFTAILHLADKAIGGQNVFDETRLTFSASEYIDSSVVKRALALADYFFASAWDIFQFVQTSVTAPAEVLMVAVMMKNGQSMASIGKAFYNDESPKAKQKMWRQVQKWIIKYPRVFNATAK